MLISACVIGLNDKAKSFIKEFKSRDYYKESDLDGSAARVHCIHVNKLAPMKYYNVLHTAITEESGAQVVSYLDGDEETPRRIPFGDDLNWLTETDGHRAVLEFIDDEPESYLESIKSQIKEGYDLHITSASLAPYKDELTQLASSSGAEIYFYENEDTAVDELLNFMDETMKVRRAAYEKRLMTEGDPCGLDMGGVDWS